MPPAQQYTYTKNSVNNQASQIVGNMRRVCQQLST